jgi:hypothetical protein
MAALIVFAFGIELLVRVWRTWRSQATDAELPAAAVDGNVVDAT